MTHSHWLALGLIALVVALLAPATSGRSHSSSRYYTYGYRTHQPAHYAAQYQPQPIRLMQPLVLPGHQLHRLLLARPPPAYFMPPPPPSPSGSQYFGLPSRASNTPLDAASPSSSSSSSSTSFASEEVSSSLPSSSSSSSSSSALSAASDLSATANSFNRPASSRPASSSSLSSGSRPSGRRPVGGAPRYRPASTSTTLAPTSGATPSDVDLGFELPSNSDSSSLAGPTVSASSLAARRDSESNSPAVNSLDRARS